jgi:ABC-type methionine transport system ATPase subunit
VTLEQLHLTFPPDQERERTVSHLRTSFSLQLNVLRANVDEQTSWMIVELQGDEDELERAVAWLIDEGVAVDRIPIDG